jgi:antitoxin (DNA-binding transcriptional repressor) of toxin-antitoxin stability system
MRDAQRDGAGNGNETEMGGLHPRGKPASAVGQGQEETQTVRQNIRERTAYNHSMAKDVISETEAASAFAALMAHVRAGADIVIENGERPVAVLHAAEPARQSISDCIALAKTHEEETGKARVLDPDFAEDVEEILSHRKPWNPPAWE